MWLLQAYTQDYEELTITITIYIIFVIDEYYLWKIMLVLPWRKILPSEGSLDLAADILIMGKANILINVWKVKLTGFWLSASQQGLSKVDSAYIAFLWGGGDWQNQNDSTCFLGDIIWFEEHIMSSDKVV